MRAMRIGPPTFHQVTLRSGVGARVSGRLPARARSLADMEWELHDGEAQHGPFTEDAVIDAIRRGLKPTTQIRPVGRERWKSLRAHAPFAAALDAAQGTVTPATMQSTPVAAANAPGGETTFLKQYSVLVTNKRAVINGTTFPLANITSVRVYEKEPPKSFAQLGFILGCIGIFWWPMFIAAGICVVLQFVIMKPVYWVRIATSGGETNAVGYPRATQAQKVVDALSNAIVSRSA